MPSQKKKKLCEPRQRVYQSTDSRRTRSTWTVFILERQNDTSGLSNGIWKSTAIPSSAEHLDHGSYHRFVDLRTEFQFLYKHTKPPEIETKLYRVLQNTAQAYNCYLCESMWGPLVVPVYLLLWMPAFLCYWFSNLKQVKKHLRCTLVRNDKSSATKKEKNGERANFLLATSSRQINGQVHTSRRGALTISLLFLALISLKQRC